MAKYKPRKNYRVSNEMAQIIGDQIDALENKTTDEFLKKASNKNHPLHSEFEWDDTKAAHEHRLSQARYLMRSIEIVYTDIDPVKAYYPLKMESDPSHVYETYKEVLNCDDSLQQLSDQYYAEIETICKKAAGLGLDTKDPAWKVIIETVNNNCPQ